MPRALIFIHPGSLGDVLLAVPAMQRLRNRFTQQTSLLVVAEPTGRLLQDLHLIDAFSPIEGAAVADLFAGSVQSQGEFSHWLGQCDCAVAWMQNKEGDLEEILRRCGCREVIVQSPFSSQLRSHHQSDRFLETVGELERVGVNERCWRVPGPIIDEGRAWLARLDVAADQPLALIHPGSGSRQKCVAPEVFVSVLEWLRREGFHALVIEGPAEGTVANLLGLLPVKPTVLRGMSLTQLAGVLAHASLYVGHDSGVTHLSSLLGVQTVALFGPTDPERWAPRGDHVRVLRGGLCTCQSWEMVETCGAKPCLAITPEQVIELCLLCRDSGATSRNPS